MRISNSLIDRYLNGDASESERIAVMKWAEENKAHADELNAMRRLYEAVLMSDGSIAPAKKRIYSLQNWGWVAAAMIILAISISLPTIVDHLSEPQYQTICAPLGQQTKTRLSDGTEVWLNSGSELAFADLTDKVRKVKLRGEAYFDVAKDSELPFIVETSQIKIKVLGTQFNVNAYDDTQSVVLVSGSVGVTAKRNGSNDHLSPNEMYTYNSETNSQQISQVNTSDYTSWIEGYLQFNNMSLDKVFKQLQNVYDITLLFDVNQAKEYKINGKLELKGGIDNALNIIKLLAPVAYYHQSESEIKIIIE